MATVRISAMTSYSTESSSDFLAVDSPAGGSNATYKWQLSDMLAWILAASGTLTNKTLSGGSISSVTSLTVANNVDIGNYQLRAKQFFSDVSTGTAPLVVASTTVVSNLNADQVDGYDVGTSDDDIPYLSDTPSSGGGIDSAHCGVDINDYWRRKTGCGGAGKSISGSGTYNLTNDDAGFVSVDLSTAIGNATIVLPEAASTNAGAVVIVHLTDTDGSRTCTVEPASGGTIILLEAQGTEKTGNPVLGSDNEYVIFMSSGDKKWSILGGTGFTGLS